MEKQLTDSEKLDNIHKKMRRMEISTHIQTTIAVIGVLALLGLISIGKVKYWFKYKGAVSRGTKKRSTRTFSSNFVSDLKAKEANLKGIKATVDADGQKVKYTKQDSA